jgi:hypothetical protein
MFDQATDGNRLQMYRLVGINPQPQALDHSHSVRFIAVLVRRADRDRFPFTPAVWANLVIAKLPNITCLGTLLPRQAS